MQRCLLQHAGALWKALIATGGQRTSLCACSGGFMVLACVHVGCQQMCAHAEAEEKSILYESWCTILGKKRGLGHHGAQS